MMMIYRLFSVMINFREKVGKKKKDDSRACAKTERKEEYDEAMSDGS